MAKKLPRGGKDGKRTTTTTRGGGSTISQTQATQPVVQRECVTPTGKGETVYCHVSVGHRAGKGCVGMAGWRAVPVRELSRPYWGSAARLLLAQVP